MKKTALALTLTFALLFSAMAGTSFLNVVGANKTSGAPIANLHASAVGSAVSDNNAETSNTELSPAELWNFTVANSTANTVSLRWREPEVANGIAYLSNTETYTIPDEPHLYPFGTPLPHTLGTTYAINITSGKELWNLTGAGSFRSLSIIDGVVYMSTSDSTVFNGQSAGASFYALDAVNGTQKWSRHFDGNSRWSKINDNMLYAYFIAPNSPSYVCAVNINNGSELWRWKTDDNDLLSLATVGDGAIYFGTYDSTDNHYFAVNTMNGSELWRIPVEGRVPGISIFDDGVVYFNSDEASYALNAQNGEQLSDTFNSTKLGVYSVNGTAFGIISCTDDAIYLRGSNGTLIALNAVNGEQLWSYDAGGYGSSIISDGIVYYHLDNILYALDASNGSSLWNYTSSDQSFLTIANGTAFFAADNTIYALNVPSAVHPLSPEPQQDAFLTTLVAAAAGASATLVGLAVLLHFKKRKR
jgi:outer membrane protein assembly factor BamB